MTGSHQVPHSGTQAPKSGGGSGGGGGAAATPPTSGSDGDLLAALLDGMDLALCAFDASGVVTHWNREASRILGWTAEDAIGREGLGGWAARPADAGQVQALLHALAGDPGRRINEFALVTKAGRRVLVRAQLAALTGAEGAPAGAYCAFSEAHAQIELERSLGLAEALFQDAPLGMILIDADLRPAVVNTVAARALRSSRDALLGRPLGEILRGGLEELETALHHVLAEGAPPAPSELWVSLRADGDSSVRRCWRSTFLRLGSPLGNDPIPLGAGWLFEDVTEAKQGEQSAALLRFRDNQLRRASRAAAECEDPMEAATGYLDFALAGFADHALIDLVAGEGRLVRVAATPTGGWGQCLPTESAGIPVRYVEGHPALRAVERIGTVRTSVGEYAGTSEAADGWAAARRWPEGTTHGMCSVLRSRSRTLGVVTFLRGASRRPFDRADANYADDVAVRVAAALDLARLLRRQQGR